jgi:hypothetical protein
MTITKEQFEIFKENFEIIETTRDISTYRVDLNYQDFADDDFDDDYFLIANWELKESEPISSDGYSIIDKETEKELVSLYDRDDIIQFITEEMHKYLKD